MTLSNYTRPGRSSSERGVDFTIRRSSQWRRHLVFTDRGVAKLLARDYKTIAVGKAALRLAPIVFKSKPAPLESLSARERRMRLKHLIAAFQKYLEHRGCAVPHCPCMIHSMLGIPQSEYVRSIMASPDALP